MCVYAYNLFSSNCRNYRLLFENVSILIGSVKYVETIMSFLVTFWLPWLQLSDTFYKLLCRFLEFRQNARKDVLSRWGSHMFNGKMRK